MTDAAPPQNPAGSEFIAKTFRGLEPVLAEELSALGAVGMAPITRGVTFKGGTALLYRACLHCRTALRILMPVARFTLKHPRGLYEMARKIDWSPYLTPKTTFAVDAVAKSRFYNHTNYPALLVKDAVVDWFREKGRLRPDVNPDKPDVLLHVHVSEESCTLSLDASGESLHRRGYHLEQGPAPLNEVLAAGMLLIAGWKGEGLFLDPMCGSGTLSAEAALIAMDKAPGLTRASFGFTGWPLFDAALYKKVRAEAEARIKPKGGWRIIAADVSAKAVEITRNNLARAGVKEGVETLHTPFEALKPPEGGGLMIMNPPYGERMNKEHLNAFYKSVGDTLKKKYAGYTAWILSANKEALKNIGLRYSSHAQLFNGALECHFQRYALYAGSVKQKHRKAGGGHDGEKPGPDNGPASLTVDDGADIGRNEIL